MLYQYHLSAKQNMVYVRSLIFLFYRDVMKIYFPNDIQVFFYVVFWILIVLSLKIIEFDMKLSYIYKRYVK